MANLLPNKEKQNLQSDFLSRKLVIASLALGILLIIVLVIIGSFLVGLFIRERSLANFSLASNQESKIVRDLDNSMTLLKKIDAEVKTINSYWSEPLISILVAKALTLKPAGLKISGIIIERVEAGKPTKLSLVGLASGRNELVNYVDLLRRDKFFTRVDLPVENLISDQGGQFVINLEK